MANTINEPQGSATERSGRPTTPELSAFGRLARRVEDALWERASRLALKKTESDRWTGVQALLASEKPVFLFEDIDHAERVFARFAKRAPSELCLALASAPFQMRGRDARMLWHEHVLPETGQVALAGRCPIEIARLALWARGAGSAEQRVGFPMPSVGKNGADPAWLATPLPDWLAQACGRLLGETDSETVGRRVAEGLAHAALDEPAKSLRHPENGSSWPDTALASLRALLAVLAPENAMAAERTGIPLADGSSRLRQLGAIYCAFERVAEREPMKENRWLVPREKLWRRPIGLARTDKEREIFAVSALTPHTFRMGPWLIERASVSMTESWGPVATVRAWPADKEPPQALAAAVRATREARELQAAANEAAAVASEQERRAAYWTPPSESIVAQAFDGLPEGASSALQKDASRPLLADCPMVAIEMSGATPGACLGDFEKGQWIARAARAYLTGSRGDAQVVAVASEWMTASALSSALRDEGSVKRSQTLDLGLILSSLGNGHEKMACRLQEAIDRPTLLIFAPGATINAWRWAQWSKGIEASGQPVKTLLFVNPADANCADFNEARKRDLAESFARMERRALEQASARSAPGEGASKSEAAQGAPGDNVDSAKRAARRL
jgi:hypothetical protein